MLVLQQQRGGLGQGSPLSGRGAQRPPWWAPVGKVHLETLWDGNRSCAGAQQGGEEGGTRGWIEIPSLLREEAALAVGPRLPP